MNIEITINRSESWVTAQNLERGENVDESIDVTVDPAELSQESRSLLLAVGDGRYPNRVEKLSVVGSGAYGTYGFYHGNHHIEIDSHTPTTEQIDAEICDFHHLLSGKHKQEEEEDAAKDAAEQAKTDARELLADDFLELAADLKLVEQRRDEYHRWYVAETHNVEECNKITAHKEDAIKILAEFLSGIPEDVKRGHLKSTNSFPGPLLYDGDLLSAACASRTFSRILEKSIEDASPDYHIFGEKSLYGETLHDNDGDDGDDGDDD